MSAHSKAFEESLLFTLPVAKSPVTEVASSAEASDIQSAILRAPAFQEPDVLSRREREVHNLVAKGLSNKEVASALFVTEKTIKFHLTAIYKKLKLKSRSQLIVQAMNARAARTAEAGL